jgi:hypothetical protein
MRHFVLSAATAALLVFIAPPAEAQGFWASLGAGTGRQRVTCEICRGDGNGGWTARAAAGTRLNARLRLGGELAGWTDRTDGVRFTYASVAPTLYWYPTGRQAYFLTAGLSYVFYRASAEGETIGASGLGFAVGTGYDLPLRGRYALTPFATYSISLPTNLTRDQAIIVDAQLSLFQVGLGVTRR